MQDESNNKKINIPNIVMGSFVVGLLCLLVSVGIVAFFSTNYMGGGGADVVLIFALPVLAVFPIGIALSIIAFKNIKDIRKKQTSISKILIIMSMIGLVGSLSFIVSIPVSVYKSARLTEEIEHNREMQKSEEEAERIAYETEPNIISQLKSYTDCYTYHDGIYYRSGRDAICSYLRYMYSNSWEEPQTGEQLDSQKYTPNYFIESRTRSNNPLSLIGISNDASEISREFLQSGNYRTRYLITPHRSCQKENNDSLISVWYLDDDRIYESGTTEDKQLVCMYYDYHSDTSYATLNQYENSSLNIYTAQFEDFYMELLRRLNMRSSDVGYNYSVPYNSVHGVFIYDNAAFMKDFFSGLVDNL